DRLLSLARQAENERAVDDDAEIVAILGEAARDVDQHALLDVVENLLIADLARQRLDARQIVGQRVVVEEKFLHLREGRLRPSQFVDHMADAAHPIAMAADGLRPEAEGAARFAAPARIKRYVGMLEIADEIILD